MHSHRLSLITAGAVATAVIAFASSMAPSSPMPLVPAAGMLLGTYAAGLGIGWMIWKRGG